MFGQMVMAILVWRTVKIYRPIGLPMRIDEAQYLLKPS
jgi:hypothetical protein